MNNERYLYYVFKQRKDSKARELLFYERSKERAITQVINNFSVSKISVVSSDISVMKYALFDIYIVRMSS